MMNYCKNCKIEYKTNLDKCLICGDNLDNSTKLPFNFKEHKKVSSFKKYFINGFILLNIISILVTTSIDYIENGTLYFSLIVSLSNLYLIAFVKLILNHFSVLVKMFTAVFLTSFFLLLFGLVINDYHWAIDIVLPFLFITNTLLLTITIIVRKKHWQSYALYLILSVFTNILIVFLNIFNISNTTWAIAASFYYGISTLLGLIIFTPKNVKEEFLRRLHI